jgi:hypothetical protein
LAITLGTTARNESVDARTALVNGGSVKIKQTSTVLATITLEATAFEAAGTNAAGSARAIGADGVAVVSSGNPLTDASADATGTANAYDVCNSGGTVIWSGTAGTVGTDMILDNASISITQEVKIVSWVHAQPA